MHNNNLPDKSSCGCKNGLVSPYLCQKAPNSESYQWWYFDVETSGGNIITIIFHANNMFCRDCFPSVSLTYYDSASGWKRRYCANQYVPDDMVCKTNFLQIGDNRIGANPSQTHVTVSLPDAIGEININGSWLKRLAAYSLTTEMVDGHQWQPIIVGAPVSGWLEIDGQRHNIEGVCYHDYNRGAGYLGRKFRRWFWGRAHADEMSLTFLVYVLHNESCRGALLIAPKDEAPRVIPINHALADNIKMHEDTVGYYYETLELSNVTGPMHSLSVQTHVTELVHAKIKPAKSDAMEHFVRYYRLMADWTFKGVTQPRLRGLTELMDFSPVRADK